MKHTKISVIPHTHWDREWYFTNNRSLIYSLHDFKEIIEYLKENEEFKCFLLDAQISILEDYLKYYNEDEELVKGLVRNGRLITGPWYTQTDLMVIGGESIVRNLYYGIRDANKLGKSMMVGYVPDCFGQSAQMPQIYNGFGIDKTVFRRGFSYKHIPNSEFIWEGSGDSKVFAHNIIDYGNMINPPKDLEDINKYLNEKIDDLGRYSTSDHIILMNGQDQRPIRKDLLEIIKKAKDCGYNIEINDLESSINELKNNSKSLLKYSGEFTFSEKSRVHKSIFSTRADLKIKNNKCENYITNILEPMCTIAYSLGQKYNHKLIEEVWKLMFYNAAHDSIGMCNSDEVNDNIENRFNTVMDISKNLFEISSRVIGESIEEKDVFQFQVYNFLPYKRSDVIKIKLYTPGGDFKIVNELGEEQEHVIISSKDVTNHINQISLHEIGVNGNYFPKWAENDMKINETDMYIKVNNIESMGYTTLYFQQLTKSNIQNEDSKDMYIKNENIKVTIDNKGNLNLENKKINVVLNGFFILEDSGDDGDTYDYSEPRMDNQYYSTDGNIENISVSKNSLVEEIKFNLKMNIPKNLDDRAVRTKNAEINAEVTITLKRKSDKVNFNVKLDNTAVEHRMRVLFKTNIESETSIADQQFGTIKRKTYLEEVEIWEKEKWVEKPRTIEPMQSFVTLRNNEYGFAVYTDCVREYQIIGKKLDTIALTLFRSVNYMGKRNLLDRPGRASGMEWETPKASLLKSMNFDFTIELYNDKTEGQLAVEAKELFTPLTAFQASEFKNNCENFIINKSDIKNKPSKYSLFEMNKGSIVLSAFKKSEEDDSYLIRIFNGELKNSDTLNIDFKNIKVDKISEVRLNEKDIINEYNSKQKLNLKVSDGEFKTIKIGCENNIKNS